MPQANLRFVLKNPAHFLAFGFGVGLIKPAPGTWGTLLALPLAYCWQITGSSMYLLALLCLPLFIIGIFVCDISGKNLGIHDFGGIVFDEIVAMLALLAFVPSGIGAWLLAFVLFRFFDILKPWPIRWIDSKVRGGLGVMLDDTFAALFAGLSFRVISYLLY